MENSSPSKRKDIDAEKVLLSLVESQNRKIALEEKSLAIQEKELDFSHNYAVAALKAQKEDRECERQQEVKIQKNLYLIIGFIFLLLLVFGGFCIWIDKDEIFKELLKIVGYAILPSVGAYYYGYNKAKSQEKQINTEQ